MSGGRAAGLERGRQPSTPLALALGSPTGEHPLLVLCLHGWDVGRKGDRGAPHLPPHPHPGRGLLGLHFLSHWQAPYVSGAPSVGAGGLSFPVPLSAARTPAFSLVLRLPTAEPPLASAAPAGLEPRCPLPALCSQ